MMKGGHGQTDPIGAHSTMYLMHIHTVTYMYSAHVNETTTENVCTMTRCVYIDLAQLSCYFNVLGCYTCTFIITTHTPSGNE